MEKGDGGGGESAKVNFVLDELVCFLTKLELIKSMMVGRICIISRFWGA
jgi:hypothetical protein